MNSLSVSLLQLREIATETKQKTQETKTQLSIIISNHRFINATLFNAIDTRALADEWQLTINSTLFNTLQHLPPLLDDLYLELVTLFELIERLIGYSNNSLSLFADIEGYRVTILSLLAGNMKLSGNISSVSSELDALNASISSLLDEITEVVTNTENCLYNLKSSVANLTNRNVELEAVNNETETELKQFLNTEVIESAHTYTLPAEIYARELINSFEQIYNLARYVPNTTVSLSLTEDQLIAAISRVYRVVAERERLEFVINRVLGDDIFTEISMLKQLIDRLDQSAVNLSGESTAVLNTINPFIDTANDLQNQLTELKRRVGILLVNSSVQFEEG